MSYETLSDESKLIRECNGFTQISNKVINHIKNGDAFLVWCYLYSKSSNWKTIKKNIKNVYGFGDFKLKRIFSYLNRSKLIKYVQETCSNGKFKKVKIKVLNGTNFDINQEFDDEHTAGRKTARAENRTNVKQGLLNKEITKQRKDTKIRSSADEHPRDFSFDRFWELYLRKQKKNEAKKLWVKNGCEKIAGEIIDHLYKRNEQEWKNTPLDKIPLPDTFLRQERWKDEIINAAKENQRTFRKPFPEIKSEVPFYDEIQISNLLSEVQLESSKKHIADIRKKLNIRKYESRGDDI